MCFVLQMYTDGPAKEPLYETIYFFKDMPLLIDIITLLTDILSHWNSRFENAWRWFICNTCAYTVLFFSPTVKKNAESVFINWMTGWFKLFYLLWRAKFFSWFFFFFSKYVLFSFYFYFLINPMAIDSVLQSILWLMWHFTAFRLVFHISWVFPTGKLIKIFREV